MSGIDNSFCFTFKTSLIQKQSFVSEHWNRCLGTFKRRPKHMLSCQLGCCFHVCHKRCQIFGKGNIVCIKTMIGFILWPLCILDCYWFICTMWPYSKQWYLGGVQLEIDIALPAMQYQFPTAFHVHQRCLRMSRGRHSLVNKGKMHSTLTRLCIALFSSIHYQFPRFNCRSICFWACPIDWRHVQVSQI